MKFPFVITGLLFCLSNLAISQSSQLLDQMKSVVIPVARIYSDSLDDYSDLLPLVERIGASKIVGLGEITHQDGSTMAAKARLVKFLHEKMGFDILLWEAGWLDCDNANTSLRNKTIPLDKIRTGGGWERERQSFPIFEYARKSWTTPSPLEMGGFDNNRGSTGKESYARFMSAFFEKFTFVSITKKEKAFTDSIGQKMYDPVQISDSSREKNQFRDGTYQRYRQIVEKLKRQIIKNEELALKVVDRREYLLTVFNLENFVVDLKENILFREAILSTMGNDASVISTMYRKWNSFRDMIMGKRILWLTDSIYKGRKMIIWAATNHLQKYVSTTKSDQDEWNWSYFPCGTYVSTRKKSDYYVIAMTAHHGESGYLVDSIDKGKTIETAAVGSIEDMGHQFQIPFAFIDVRNAPPESWLKKKFIARALGFRNNKTQWSKVIDAFFFIDEMEPVKHLNYVTPRQK